MRLTELIKLNLYQHKIYYINSTVQIIAYLIDVLIHAQCFIRERDKCFNILLIN